MKRTLSGHFDEDEELSYQPSGPENVDSLAVEGKRARSKQPPVLVGPLVFDANGTKLERALLAVEPSSLPGVHRMAPQSNSLVRVWAPNMLPSHFLQVDVSELLRAVDGKCIFLFDSRLSESDLGVSGSDRAIVLFQSETIKRYGILVSKYPPPSMGQVFVQQHIPTVQDPDGVVGTLCNYSSYLGPTAVLVKNNEVKATCMLSRAPDAIERTLSEWLTV